MLTGQALTAYQDEDTERMQCVFIVIYVALVYYVCNYRACIMPPPTGAGGIIFSTFIYFECFY